MSIKVVCIHNSKDYESRNTNSGYDYKGLIVGKVYDVVDAGSTIYGGNSYLIDGWWESKSNFITLKEYRDKKLESIGI